MRVTGRPEGPANRGRLCVKGRYGFDYAEHPHRLTVPLVRREEYYPKHALSPELEEGDYRRKRRDRKGAARDAETQQQIMPAFREATWDEALDLMARRFTAIKQAHGPGALAGFGSAKCSNEDNYLFQKLIRAAFGTNNVDHCTRLCHASSVAALMETIGSGSVSNPVRGRAARGRGDRGRLEHDREPPGGGDVHQAGGAAGNDADRDGPAAAGPGARCRPTTCGSSRGRTWRCSTA